MTGTSKVVHLMPAVVFYCMGEEMPPEGADWKPISKEYVPDAILDPDEFAKMIAGAIVLFESEDGDKMWFRASSVPDTMKDDSLLPPMVEVEKPIKKAVKKAVKDNVIYMPNASRTTKKDPGNSK